MTRGANVLFEGGLRSNISESALDTSEGGVGIWRAPGILERFSARGDGVEQCFLLKEMPRGNGNLEIVCALSYARMLPLPPRADRAGGIGFVNTRGGMVARYGEVVVRDANMRGISIEPKLAADGRSLAFSVPSDWLARATYPVVVDPLIGTDVQVSPDNVAGVGPPTIAAGSNGFLVVWNDLGADGTAPVITGALISPSGIVSTPFAISAPNGLSRNYRNQRISAAFDGTNWLIVWSDDRQVGPGVRGALVTSAGSLVSGNDFLIAATPGLIFEDPIVAFNGSDFMVAWQDVPSGAAAGSQINFARVTSTGIVVAPQIVPATVAPINQSLLFLSAQKPVGDTLLLYREVGETPPQTRSVRIATDGTIRDPGGTSLFKENIADGGFGRAIGVTFVGVSSNGNAAPQWHILSTADQTLDSSIYRHKLDLAGTVTPPSGVFATMGLGPAGTADDVLAPAFAGSAEWLFIRNERVSSTVFHLIGKRVTFDGQDKDPVPFQIDTSTQGVLRLPVAAQSANSFLAAWLDGRRGTTQPADSRNIFAAVVDATSGGTAGTLLVPVASASPTSGEAPLTVMFDASASQGSYDFVSWNFGDGTGASTAQASHTYKNNGIFIAQLELARGSYTVFDAIVISVGAGMGPESVTIVGVPFENSPGMQTRLFINSVNFRADFSTPSNDILRATGIVSSGDLPVELTGVAASLSLGSKTFAFNLDAKGSFKSDTLNFAVDPATGAFSFEATGADIHAAVAEIGGQNGNVAPAVILTAAVNVSIGTSAASALVGVAYKAVKDVGGAGNFVFRKTGRIVSGSFVIQKATVKEEVQPKSSVKAHTFSITGQLAKPNGGTYVPAAGGSLTLGVGDYLVSLPVEQFQIKHGRLKFIGPAGATGLKKFSLDVNSGKFSLQVYKIPALGTGASHMPLAKSGQNIVQVNLNLSFGFALENNEIFSAGRYLFLARKNAATKNWSLR